jgi:linoleoyl-CoA desaturase
MAGTERDPLGGFQRALRRAANERLAEDGRGAGRGGRTAWCAALPAIAWFYGSVVALLVFPTRIVPLAIASVSAGLAMAATLTVVQHDALHHAIASRRWVNAALAQLAAPVGVSRRWWSAKHTAGHHAHTNVVGLDPDIDKGSLLRLAPQQPHRPWHRWQHVYAWALYPLSLLGMQIVDLEFVVAGRVKGERVENAGLARTAVLVADKLAGPVVLVSLLMLVHPAIVVTAIWLGATLVAGAALSFIFSVTHYVEAVEFSEATPTGRGADGWAVAQVLGTSNVVIRSRFLCWYSGGLLDHHIEHHLFPRIAHVHHKVIAPVVRATCQEFGVPYHQLPSMRAAIASHMRHLRQLGQARDAAAPHLAVLLPRH